MAGIGPHPAVRATFPVRVRMFAYHSAGKGLCRMPVLAPARVSPKAPAEADQPRPMANERAVAH